MTDTKHSPRQGDVIRVPSLGPLKANVGSDLVFVFLGTCKEGVEPDVPAYLKKLGFARTHVFEAAYKWSDGVTTFHVFTAPSPRAAVESACRLGHTARDPEDVSLHEMSLRLLRLGDVDEKGRLTEESGPVFAAWNRKSGKHLEALLDQKCDEEKA